MKNLREIPEVKRFLNRHNVKTAIVPDPWYNRIKFHGYNWASPLSIDILALIELVREDFQATWEILKIKDVTVANEWLCHYSKNPLNKELLADFDNNDPYLPLRKLIVHYCEVDMDFLKRIKREKFTPYWHNYGQPSEDGFEYFSTNEKMEWWSRNYHIIDRKHKNVVRCLVNSDSFSFPEPYLEFGKEKEEYCYTNGRCLLTVERPATKVLDINGYKIKKKISDYGYLNSSDEFKKETGVKILDEEIYEVWS